MFKEIKSIAHILKGSSVKLMWSDLLDDLAVKIWGLIGHLSEEHALQVFELFCDLGDLLPRVQLVNEARE